MQMIANMGSRSLLANGTIRSKLSLRFYVHVPEKIATDGRGINDTPDKHATNEQYGLSLGPIDIPPGEQEKYVPDDKRCDEHRYTPNS